MNALDTYKHKTAALQKVAKHRQTLTTAVHAVELGAGSLAAGALDGKWSEWMGAKPSLLSGIAITVAGVALEQPHAAAFGAGMILPHLYAVGGSLTSPSTY
jgi:hypothetical protein